MMDAIKTFTAIEKLIEYNWENEFINFCETYNVEIQSQDSLEPWIKWCEDNGATTHIFYHLMILKHSYTND